MKRFLVIFALAVPLTACISFLPEPEAPDGFYRLSEVTAAETVPVSETVLVRRPDAPRHLAGSDIIVEEASGAFTVMKNAHWADRMPRLLQMTLLDYINSEGNGAALSPQSGTRATFELVWRVSDFQVDGDRAIVQGELTLLDGTTREPVDQITLESSQPIASGNTSSRVGALSGAGKDFARQAARFVTDAISKADSVG